MEKHFPEWLSKKIKWDVMVDLQKKLRRGNLFTICEEARCPNISECFSSKTASFLILGNHCTRGCAFCNVTKGNPKEINSSEIREIGNLAQQLNLKYVVITSVTRDDLPDGGAEQFSKTITYLKRLNPSMKIDVLTPDFKGDVEALKKVLDAKPDVFSHNIETTRRLTRNIRSTNSCYDTSLKILKEASASKKINFIKSGFMVGLGEEGKEIKETIYDLKNVGCNVLTIGQYLRPNKKCTPVVRYVEPEQFEKYEEWAKEAGFKKVISGPYVRSSYNLKSLFE